MYEPNERCGQCHGSGVVEVMEYSTNGELDGWEWGACECMTKMGDDNAEVEEYG